MRATQRHGFSQRVMPVVVGAHELLVDVMTILRWDKNIGHGEARWRLDCMLRRSLGATQQPFRRRLVAVRAPGTQFNRQSVHDITMRVTALPVPARHKVTLAQ